eukprot:Amastigsp_a2762_139.p2 type:complete len:236 gc:universal Amastigsp_a2762_139:1024-317(-)
MHRVVLVQTALGLFDGFLASLGRTVQLRVREREARLCAHPRELRVLLCDVFDVCAVQRDTSGALGLLRRATALCRLELGTRAPEKRGRGGRARGALLLANLLRVCKADRGGVGALGNQSSLALGGIAALSLAELAELGLVLLAQSSHRLAGVQAFLDFDLCTFGSDAREGAAAVCRLLERRRRRLEHSLGAHAPLELDLQARLLDLCVVTTHTFMALGREPVAPRSCKLEQRRAA